MSPYPPPTFTSAHGRARVVKILLIAGAIIAVLSLLSDALSIALFAPIDDQDFATDPIGAVRLLIGVALGLLDLAIYVTTAVFFLMWLYRAHSNLFAIDSSRPLDYSTGWAVGSFFIPFVSLIVPYRAVKELWQRSGSPDEALLFEPSPPGFFPFWWLFWLLSAFAGNISFRISFDRNVEENMALTISIIAGGLSFIAAVFAYLVVDEIDKRQEETGAKLNLGKFSGPPPPPANFAASELSSVSG